MNKSNNLEVAMEEVCEGLRKTSEVKLDKYVFIPFIINVALLLGAYSRDGIGGLMVAGACVLTGVAISQFIIKRNKGK